MTLQGKGFFTNNLAECEKGQPALMVKAAQEAGLSHVIVRVAESEKPFGIDDSGTDITLPAVQAFKQAGIAVWGWHHLRGVYPLLEAQVATERILTLGLEGYVINAESEFEAPGKAAVAELFMSLLRSNVKVELALSSFRFPNFHPEFPWSAFLEVCDLHMPKVFWEQAHNAGEQLIESKRQCEALPYARPLIPTGAAYRTTGWAAQPADLTDFLETARNLNAGAVNFFHWAICRNALPEDWQTIARYHWLEQPHKINA